MPYLYGFCFRRLKRTHKGLRHQKENMTPYNPQSLNENPCPQLYVQGDKVRLSFPIEESEI